MKKLLLAVSMLGFFAAGYIVGSIQARESIALELGGVSGLSGTITSLKNLGATVVEMEKNVSKLQENINTVKKIKDDVATYQGIYEQVTGAKKQELLPQQQKVSPELQKGVRDLLTPQQKQQTK